MVQFIDDHRDVFGVEPICAVLPIAPSTYHRHWYQRTNPAHRSARAQRDDQLRVEIQRVYDEHQQVYGPRKVWKQLRREGVRVARCTVARRPGVASVTSSPHQRLFARMTSTGQLRDLVIEQLLDVHQAQRHQGSNHFHLGVHIEPGVLLAPDDVHLPQTTGLLAFPDRS